QAANAGSDFVVVSNVAGTTNSSTVTLTLLTPSAYGSRILGDGAVAFYPLDETSGTTAFDHVGGNDGVYQNSPSLNVPGPSSYIPAGASFNGVNQWADLGNPSALNFSGPITLEAWIQPAASQNSFADVLGHGYDTTFFN